MDPDLPDLPEPLASPSVFVPDWRDLGVPPQIKVNKYSELIYAARELAGQLILAPKIISFYRVFQK